MSKHIPFIALFVNRRAGNGRSVHLAETVAQLLRQRNIDHELVADPWPDDLERYEEVWIFGGDGTVNYFINLYPDTRLPISIWPGGTGNDIAWKLYGNKEADHLVSHLLKASVSEVDAGICNGKLYLNGVGIGFDGEVLKSIRSIRLAGGHLGYLLAVMKNIFTYREPAFQVTFDGRIVNGHFLLVNISNSSRTGGGFMVSPLAELNDGWLNLVLVRKVHRLKRIFYLPKIEKGKHLGMKETEHQLVKKTTILCQKELPAQIDGELFYAAQFEIQILEKKFRIKY